MDSYHLINFLENLYLILAEANPLKEFLSQVEALDEGIKKSRRSLLSIKPDSSSNSINLVFNAFGQYVNEIRTVIDKVKESRPQPIFKSAIKLSESINKYEKSKDHEELEILVFLKKEIASFEEIYQDVLQGYTEDSILCLVELSISLKKLISGSAEAIRLVTQNLQNDYTQYDGLSEISLFFESNHIYSEFVTKTDALQKIYSEVCSLLSISESDFPLRISKIESGSLWIKVFGESKVTNFILSLFKDTIDYFYRNYTNEGKIQALPRKIEALESALELTRKLESAGIDTMPLQDSIQKSAFALGESLNSLIGGESTIDINGETISIEPNKNRKSLVGGKTHLLSSSNSQSNTSET
jgi:hypothetical protein